MSYLQTPITADGDVAIKTHPFVIFHDLFADIDQGYLTGKILHGLGERTALIGRAQDSAAYGVDLLDIAGS